MEPPAAPLNLSSSSEASTSHQSQAAEGMDDSDYVPSKSSLLMASEEVGDDNYFEHENGEEEESGPIQDDVEDINVDLKTGFVLMDISILLEFLSTSCFKCMDKNMTVTQKRSGAMLSFHVSCSHGHSKVLRTQNIIKCQPEGNAMLANAVLSSGMTFATWTRFCLAMKMPSISNSTYYTLITKYVMPVIFRAWNDIRIAGLAAINANDDLATWIADGQFDSPGYSAKYLIETIMDSSTGFIVDFLLYQKGLASGELESKGLRILLNRLKEDVAGKIGILCSDRNLCVQKMMREEFGEIQHQYDCWHMAKSLKKKMKKQFAKATILMSWSKSISNHLWWSAQTCNGNPETLTSKWCNLVKHLQNQHELCEHEELSQEETRKKAWVVDRRDVKKLQAVIEDKRFNKDLKKCSAFVHTGNLESVHSKANIYRPKKYHFTYAGMMVRTCLAYIDHNNNLNKKVVRRVSEYSKETGKFKSQFFPAVN
jgi:hypothetical protein